MSDPIVSIEQIKTEARAAAAIYTDINDACPYPFGTSAAKIFESEFQWVRSVLAEKEQQQ